MMDQVRNFRTPEKSPVSESHRLIGIFGVVEAGFLSLPAYRTPCRQALYRPVLEIWALVAIATSVPDESPCIDLFHYSRRFSVFVSISNLEAFVI